MTRDAVGRPLVVGIEQRDVVAADLVQAAIDGCDEASVLLAHGADPLAVAGQHLLRLVGRAVIDDDQLKAVLRPVLAERGVDRGGQEAREVVGRDHDRDERRLRHAATLSGAATRSAGANTGRPSRRAQRTSPGSPACSSM